jgi:putative transcriptional regulator
VSKTTTTAKPRETRKGKTDKYGMTAADWARLEAMTDAEVLAAARSDPDTLPLEDRRPGSVGPARRVSLAKRIRWRLRMSQSEFAKAFHIPVGTLRDWEQHRREPDQAARAYLEVIARNPKAVIAALHPRQ